MRIRIFLPTAITALVLTASAAIGHEFWIAPEVGNAPPGKPFSVNLMVGQRQVGTPYPYLSNRFTRFTVTAGGKTRPVTGQDGDIPASWIEPARPGLHIVAHQTVPFRATYKDWSLFQRYLDEEGLQEFARVHRARGLPDAGFAERYTRYAKALVLVGQRRAQDRDQPVGLALELVVLGDPFAPAVDRLEVQLLWHGQPLAGRQITIFRAAGQSPATRDVVRTDKDGRARIAAARSGRHLLNAVHLEPADAKPVVWSSHWASLTFTRGE